MADSVLPASGGTGDMGTPVRFVTPIAVYGGLFRERFVPFLLHFLLLGLGVLGAHLM